MLWTMDENSIKMVIITRYACIQNQFCPDVCASPPPFPSDRHINERQSGRFVCMKLQFTQAGCGNWPVLCIAEDTMFREGACRALHLEQF